VAAAVVAVDLVGAPSGAQEAEQVLTPITGTGVNADQAISDDGRIVVYEETTIVDEAAVTRVLIHDRVAGTTIGVPDAGAMNPSISGNGCFVTYSRFTPAVMAATTTSTTTTTTTTTTSTTTTTTTEPPVSSSSSTTEAPDVGDGVDGLEVDAPQGLVARQAAEVETPASASLHAFDRCADPLPKQSVVVAGTISTDQPIGAAAVSYDGAVIAYSDGDDIVRMQGTLTGYAPSAPFDSALNATPGVVTGPNLDITPDGSTIVFEAGVDATPDDPTDAVSYGVHRWDSGTPATVVRIASNSVSPTVSADGSLVAFQARPGSDAGFLGVVIQTQDPDVLSTNISIDPFGRQPDLSEDGRHVVYNTMAESTTPYLAMTSSVGDTAAPFTGVSVIDLSEAANGADATTYAVSGPVVSALGDAVAFDADVTSEPAGTPQVVAVRTLAAAGQLDADAYDLGRGDVGDTLTATATYTNQGPASVRFDADSISIESPFALGVNDCADSVGPGQSCEIEITVTIDSLEDIFGSITLTTTAGSVTAELTALGAVVTTSTDRATTTTPPNTTPRNTTVNTTRTTTRNTTRTTTRNTTRTTTRNTVTTMSDIDLPPTFEPSSFEFAPTIINAGARTASIEIVNTGGSTQSVATAAFADPDLGFSVLATTCTSITVGARCSLDLQFAPTTEGALATDLVVAFSSGDEIRAAVSGVGAPEPTLTVIPGVATVGQVVTVQGSGFPAGSTVSLAFGALDDERDVVVNDSGVFNLPLVVSTNTSAGPMTVTVAGQPESFGDIETEMLVTRTTRRTNPGVLGSLGARVGS
jgi:HYDIN/CFA65/VesB-like, Ig-like domain